MSVAPDGSFAISWMTTSTDDGSQYLQALQYNASGVALEDSPLAVGSWPSDILVSTPTLSVDGAGGFVSTWTQEDDTTGNADLMARHFDSSGSAPDAFLIDDNAKGNPFTSFPSQSGVNASGNWGVIWTSAVTGNLMGQFYNAEDDPLGNAFEVASPGSAVFGASTVLASNAQGDLLAAWSIESLSDDGTDGYAYYAQQLQLNQPPTVSTMPDITVAEGVSSSTIDLSSYFSDADIPYGDWLSYTASSSNTGIVSTSVSGDQLTLNYPDTADGTATVTVEATNSIGNTVSTSFYVDPPAPTLSTTSVTEQLERGGGVLSMSQLVAGVTTYNSLEGIAIVGTDLPHGSLQYSTDGGTSWASVGSVSDSTALLLSDDSSTELRFNPTDAYIGDLADAITFQAWDQAPAPMVVRRHD